MVGTSNQSDPEMAIETRNNNDYSRGITLVSPGLPEHHR